MDHSPATYEQLVESSVQGTVFHMPWWLDAVAPGAWHSHELRGHDGVTAAWPTVSRRTPFGRVHFGPPLTPYLGPVFAPDDRQVRMLARQAAGLDGLLENIGPFALLEARCAPGFDYWGPLRWNQFEQTTAYTFRLHELDDLERVYAGVESRQRRLIRKARNVLEVGPGTVEDVLPMIRASFLRQGAAAALPSEDLIRRIDVAAGKRGARDILVARDAAGVVHGVLFLVHDRRFTYSLLTGIDTERRGSGAMPLLMWSAIERASACGRAFDFEGSSIESIERFFRSFGGDPTPCSVLTSARSTSLAVARRARRLARRG